MPAPARFLAAALAWLALAGCGDAHATPLKDLAPMATAFVSSSGDNAGLTVAGGVSFPAGVCPTLRSEARATLNGVDLPFTQRGRRYQTASGAESCDEPTFATAARATFPTSGAAGDVLIISDESATWTIAAQNLVAARHLMLESPAGGHVRAGDTVTVLLSPEPAPIVAADVSFLSHPEQRPDGTVQGRFEFDVAKSQVHVEGARVRFAFPAQPPESGPGFFGVGLSLGTTVSRCEGPAHCTVSANFLERIDVQID